MIIKTAYILFLLFLFSNISFSTEFWVHQQSPTTKWLFKCFFTDSLYGWVVGDSGIIVHTSNGGQNWVIQNSNIDYFIEDVFFLNRRLGWAIANDFYYFGTTIITTTNGGITWNSRRYPDTTFVLRTVYFNDSLNGWLGGHSAVILNTTNGGINWTRISEDTAGCTGFRINQFVFHSNPLYAFACGGYIDIAGVVWRTTNSGLIWKGICIAPEPLYEVKFIDSLTLIGAGGDFEYGLSVVKSTDGGINWEYNMLNIYGTGYAIAYRTPSEAWIPLGYAQNWAVSLDSGNTWFELNAQDTTAIYDVTFVSPYHGWAVGSNGVILKYNTEIIGINNQNQNLIHRSHKLYQNYPNPFNFSTTIQYHLIIPTRVIIKIFDLLGREVRVLLNEYQNKGTHKIKLDFLDLPSGIYLYQLITTDGYSKSHKMVILR